MKVVGVLFVLVALVFQQSQAVNADLKRNAVVTKRSASTAPTIVCNDNNKGETFYSKHNPTIFWVCENSKWQSHRIVPATGESKEFSASSCKQIMEVLSTDCQKQVTSGVYWVQGKKFYCDMTTDKGGWTLVWKHTYMKVSTPLTTNMFYFSNDKQLCVKETSGSEELEDWCNIPNKAYFNPTEQMIVAYHKDTIVYAYKGYFNCNINQTWAGGILIEPKKVIDECKNHKETPPAPSVHRSGILGLSFDKHTPSDHSSDCDTYGEKSTTETPTDCRWHDCGLPSSISGDMNVDRNTDMTMAIFVR